MHRPRVILGTVLLLMFLVILPPQFPQNASPAPENPDLERRAQALGCIRTINTVEVSELTDYGSYAGWETLLAHQPDINQCAQKYGLKLGHLPEVLPGLSLRLNVSADRKGYDLVVRDLVIKQDSYAAYSNEEGLIWVATPLQ